MNLRTDTHRLQYDMLSTCARHDSRPPAATYGRPKKTQLPACPRPGWWDGRSGLGKSSQPVSPVQPLDERHRLTVKREEARRGGADPSGGSRLVAGRGYPRDMGRDAGKKEAGKAGNSRKKQDSSNVQPHRLPVPCPGIPRRSGVATKR